MGELAREVSRVAGEGRYGQELCERVAARLLDRARVRVATAEECSLATTLLDGVDLASRLREGTLSPCLVARVEELLQNGGVLSPEQLRGLAGRVAERISVAGC